MNAVVTFAGGATILTVIRQLASPGDLAALNLPRTIVGGILTTAGLLTIGQWSPDTADKLAALIFVTAALIHGVRLAEIANSYINQPKDKQS
jgi:hypothetical protein